MVTTIICTIQHEQGSALKKIETNFAQLRQIHGFHKQIEKKICTKHLIVFGCLMLSYVYCKKQPVRFFFLYYLVKIYFIVA